MAMHLIRGLDHYKLPDDFDRIVGDVLLQTPETAHIHKLSRITYETMLEYRKIAEKKGGVYPLMALPVFVALHMGRIYFFPVPDQNCSALIKYVPLIKIF